MVLRPLALRKHLQPSRTTPEVCSHGPSCLPVERRERSKALTLASFVRIAGSDLARAGRYATTDRRIQPRAMLDTLPSSAGGFVMRTDA